MINLNRYLLLITIILLIVTNKKCIEFFNYKYTPLMDDITTYTVNNKNKLFILGSVHGNEPAGTDACKLLIKKLKNCKLKNGTLSIYTKPNPYGYNNNIRYQHTLLNRDINRNYINNGRCNVSKFIIKNIKNYTKNDLIIDLHEGYDYHKLNSNSVGSTIIPLPNKFCINIANKMVKKLNDNIDEKHKKFTVLINDPNHNDPYGSFRDWCLKNKKNYILVELTGQNNKQHINIRVNQNITLLIECLKSLIMIN
tara:strand:+ start:2399 stop:3157 length:759 start_codon:yes stop_codon:yes gene_type:complete